ncbi:MAG: recombinase family protein [Candidatus Thorarchaeota archaeon]
MYTRVSTQEQADFGTSLGDQESTIKKICQQNDMEIIREYQDDCSGKTFDRPSFKQMESDIASKRINPTAIIVARMDRFSRGGLHAGLKIVEYRKIGIDVIPCDIYHDLSIPENWYAFAYQIISPQAENERRAINTRNGMRSAIRQGRYMGKAPFGYDNVKSDGVKTIVPNDDAPLVEEAFNEIAKQQDSVIEVFRNLQKKGLYLHLSRFYVTLKSVVYIGKVLLKEYKDEPEQIVDGIHEPIIDILLFNRVQDILNGKKKPYNRTNRNDENLPLRGHLICYKCGGILTGSTTTGGSGKKYPYYHCQNDCKERHKATVMNDDFIRLLDSMKVPEGFLRLYREILRRVFRQKYKTRQDKVKEVEKKIKALEQRLDDITDKYGDNKMSDSSFTRAETRYNTQINELHGEILVLRNEVSPIDAYLESGVTLLSDLPTYYTNADVETKKLIVSSIFPENLIYDGEIYRTPKLNAFLSHIHSNIKVYEEGGKEKASISESLSTKVAPTRIELVSKV